MNDYILFIIFSLLIVLVSKHVLFKPKTHGFYRFLAWECILWLFIKNIRFWFIKPFSLPQIISWIFLIYCAFLVISGALMLKKIGKPHKKRKDETIISIEKTTKLVETGIYKYVRHPLYGSLLFLSWGIFLKNTEPVLLIIAILSTVFLFTTSLIEEKEDIQYFGKSYKKYMKKTKMFVPFVI